MNRPLGMDINGVKIEPEFAEAFDMAATRLVVTAADDHWLQAAIGALTGFGTSVIGCGLEIAMEQKLSSTDTPDGRVGCSVLAFAMSSGELIKRIPTRVGQCLLTCPTSACFAGLPNEGEGIKGTIALGKQVRFFGDGYQIAKKIEGRRYWRIPVMDGEFICEHTTGRTAGVGGGNFLLIGETLEAVSRAARIAVEAIESCPGVIAPFPGGVARSGSKVGSKYPSLFASTNDAYCPTLRSLVKSQLLDNENAVLEIVLDGLSFAAIADAIRIGIQAAASSVGSDQGLTRISAGNYGGKLGPHHFHLHEIMSS